MCNIHVYVVRELSPCSILFGFVAVRARPSGCSERLLPMGLWMSPFEFPGGPLRRLLRGTNALVKSCGSFVSMFPVSPCHLFIYE